VRPLGSVTTNQEILYHAHRIVEVVMDDICALLGESDLLTDLEIHEIVSRLKLANHLIRDVNGANG